MTEGKPAPMQILVPIAGASTFFNPEDYHFPKPLIEVAGMPMIQRVVANLSSVGKDARFLFVCAHHDVANFSLGETLHLLAENSAVIPLKQPCQGALCSALMAIDQLDRTAPLIIANGDQVIDANLATAIATFEQAGADAGVITFESIHPRWSYVRLTADGMVEQAAEKRVISDTAIAGFYYFRTGQIFLDAALRTIDSEASVDDLFFIAPTLNEVVLNGGRVMPFRIRANQFHSFYSPAKIQEYEETNPVATAVGPRDRHPKINVVIPAAGEGSRFAKAGYPVPKPYIDVKGMPMIEHVLQNVKPKGGEVHLLLREAHMEAQPQITSRLMAAGHRIHGVSALTEGTACTLLLARAAFDEDAPLLVANSDQLVDFDVDAYVDDCLERGLDGSILVFRDVHMDPKWSFAKLDDKGLVTDVQEKKPISDLATVGIYLFTSGSAFVKGAIDMIARNDRVNNEFYTAPVYNYMIKNGAKIGVFEVPANAMWGLGTPPDLEAYLAAHPETVPA